MKATVFGWLLGVAVAVTPAAAQVTTRASVGVGGVQGNGGSNEPSISADGRVVAFRSGASGLVAGDTNAVGDVFVRDLASGATERTSVGAGGGEADRESYLAALSGDGRYVVFTSSATNLDPAVTNGVPHVYLRDRASATTARRVVARNSRPAARAARRPAPAS